MPRKPPGPVLRETNRSITAAVKDGTLDARRHAGPIAVLRKLAEQIDHPDFPIIDGRLDNVSMPTYLRTCAQWRLTPEGPKTRAAKSAVDPEEGGGAGGDSNGNQGGTVSRLRDAERRRARRTGSA